MKGPNASIAYVRESLVSAANRTVRPQNGRVGNGSQAVAENFWFSTGAQPIINRAKPKGAEALRMEFGGHYQAAPGTAREWRGAGVRENGQAIGLQGAHAVSTAAKALCWRPNHIRQVR